MSTAKTQHTALVAKATSIGTGIGQPVRRKEDLRLLTGQGRYSDDLVVPGQTHAFVLRSPNAHADIKRIETAAQRRRLASSR